MTDPLGAHWSRLLLELVSPARVEELALPSGHGPGRLRHEELLVPVPAAH